MIIKIQIQLSLLLLHPPNKHIKNSSLNFYAECLHIIRYERENYCVTNYLLNNFAITFPINLALYIASFKVFPFEPTSIITDPFESC